MEQVVQIPQELVERLRSASTVVVLTGAGVSAESGVPTFRDAQTGLWAQYDPAQLATPEAFARDPELVWRWYLWRRELVAGAEPNPGHRALAELQDRVPSLLLVTQNVDSLHQRAGSRDVVELHGNLTRTRCASCSTVHEAEVGLDDGVPRCSSCDGLLRPDVVWFGEMLPLQALERAATASRGCDLFLTVGTSALVYPAAGLPYEALTGGAVVVEVNPAPTPFSDRAHHSLRGPSGTALPALVEAAWPGGAG